MRRTDLSGAYLPPAGDWRRTTPEAAGFDPARLANAVRFATEDAATDWPTNLSAGLGSATAGTEPAPWNEVLGPTRDRGEPNGILLRGGEIVAEWGDTERVDMTFSIAKSYLAVLVGIAVDRGLIRSIDDPMRDYALDAGFEHPQNQTISWRHMLQQTSEWQGSLWDKPDLIDHHRQVSAAGENSDNSKKGTARELRAPGEFWEYNDVRVNRLSFSLMQVFGRPLPEVLHECIMAPIGASGDWRWHGYRNSYYEIDGKVMQSVPGGSHWGGGLWIASRDHARFGLLMAERGCWQGRQLVSAEWVRQLTEPCPLNPSYGGLWWLNAARLCPDLPDQSFFAFGAGSNLIWVDRSFDLVLVARWIDQHKLNPLCAGFATSLV